MSFFHSVSAYWQALLSALEGNAMDCATSILLRISPTRGSSCFLTPGVAERSSQHFAASFCIEDTQSLHLGHNWFATGSRVVNALLRDRGETLRYNSKEIGWKLRSLGLLSRHTGMRKALRFSRDVRRQIHRLAAQFGLQLPRFADCEDCKGCN